jgi:hypothetical protein
VTWKSDEISPTLVPKVSLANGLLYLWTKPAGDDRDPWYLAALDARTGKTIYKQLAGHGLGFNNNYAPVTLGPDGTAYTGVLGGLVAIRDATPPPGAGTPTGGSGAACAKLPGPALGKRGTRLRLVPRGLSDVTITRQRRRGKRVQTRTVRRVRGISAQRVISTKGYADGVYVAAFRSGGEVRRRVFGIRAGRLGRAIGRLEVVRSCGRAMTAQALFDARGLRVRVVPADPGAKVALRAHRPGKGNSKRIKPVRVVRSGGVRALFRLPRGGWQIAVFVNGRNIGKLITTRPR